MTSGTEYALPAPRTARGAFERWIRRRTPRAAGPVRLTRRRIYILPTRFGYGYGALLIVMLLGAINYGNSMAFALTFLLGGVGLVVMYHTHGNLQNLSIGARVPRPVFAGQALSVELEILNATHRARYALSATWPGQPAGTPAVDVAAGTHCNVTLTLATDHRGWLAVPRFVITSEFPLGLFHAWAWIEIDVQGLVYPHPAGSATPPTSTGAAGTRHAARRVGTDDFLGLRDYHPGDPLHTLYMKSLAGATPPLVKEFAATLDDTLWLDWNATTQHTTEARLSQLTRWLLTAEARHLDYGLRLSGVVRPPACGGAHRRACLRALALYDPGNRS
ncbi:MAG TPA: DUF58 domain-containing protein [Nevskiaceae bacterium]|nr:DUF58 domain-containing protein [Nevskiaceae bacterium]